MAEKVKIAVSETQTVTALHGKPGESAPNNHKKTLVIMLHGFPGHKSTNNDLYGDLESLLTEKGFHTLRLDFRGCGESDGGEEDFMLTVANKDIQHVLRWAENKDYRQHIFIGEGLGSTLAIINCNTETAALVLLWPILDPQMHGEKILSDTKLDGGVKEKGYIEQEGHKIGTGLLKELKTIKFFNVMREVTVPTLILHGAQDKAIPIEQIDFARTHMNPKRIEITTFHDGKEGLQKLSHRKMMFHNVVEFVERQS